LFGLIDAYNKDPAPKKISLGIGAYRDDAGKPYVLPSVRAAEEALLAAHMNHECVSLNFNSTKTNPSYGVARQHINGPWGSEPPLWGRSDILGSFLATLSTCFCFFTPCFVLRVRVCAPQVRGH
jgi:hypothetical protein